jgi:hypothetical protein
VCRSGTFSRLSKTHWRRTIDVWMTSDGIRKRRARREGAFLRSLHCCQMVQSWSFYTNPKEARRYMRYTALGGGRFSRTWTLKKEFDLYHSLPRTT